MAEDVIEGSEGGDELAEALAGGLERLLGVLHGRGPGGGGGGGVRGGELYKYMSVEWGSVGDVGDHGDVGDLFVDISATQPRQPPAPQNPHTCPPLSRPLSRPLSVQLPFADCIGGFSCLCRVYIHSLTHSLNLQQAIGTYTHTHAHTPAMPNPPEPSGSAPDIDILPSNLQIHPPLVPEQSSHLTSEESRNLITANFTHFRDDPFSFLREISLHYSGTGWRAYDAPIGQKVFYKGFSEEMKTAVLRSAMLIVKLRDLAEKRVLVEEEMGVFGGDVLLKRVRRKKEVERQLQEVTEKIVDGMICKFESKSFIRVRISISCSYPSTTSIHLHNTLEILPIGRWVVEEKSYIYNMCGDLPPPPNLLPQIFHPPTPHPPPPSKS